MYPPETSLIPVTVSLARFVEANGFVSMFGNFPYWYLGSTPFRYLTGLIIPLILTIAHKVIKDISLFDITIYLVLLSFAFSVIGWVCLVKRIQTSKYPNFQAGKKLKNTWSFARLQRIMRSIFGQGIFVLGVLLLILPWRYLSGLALSEASLVIAKNFLPFVLLAFWNYYQFKDRKSTIIAVVLTSILLLINTTIFSILLVGLAALVLAASFKEGKFRRISKRARNTLFVILYSLFIVTLWYTPGYWLTVINNPSVGGASGIKIFVRIFDLLRASIPLVLAIFAVYFSGRVKSKLTIFSLSWTLTFLFLTVFRFIGDPDFWTDWSSWFGELEIGIALLSSKVIYDFRFKIHDISLSKAHSLALITLLLPYYLTWRVYIGLGEPELISKKIPKGVQSLDKLSLIAGKNRVFLSGSTVFWANSLYDIYQLRGGRDQVAVHPSWDTAAYELREGKDPELSEEWLDELKINYVLVHGPKSPEYYHDFKNLDKWSVIGKVVWEGNGDVIYEFSR